MARVHISDTHSRHMHLLPSNRRAHLFKRFKTSRFREIFRPSAHHKQIEHNADLPRRKAVSSSRKMSNWVQRDLLSGMGCFLIHPPQANSKKSWHGSAVGSMAWSRSAAANTHWAVVHTAFSCLLPVPHSFQWKTQIKNRQQMALTGLICHWEQQVSAAWRPSGDRAP